jgi:ATP-binding cassette subfamily D (ALD) long-chain fatty acid import protein
MSSRALRGPSVLSASQRDVLRSHLKSAFNGYLRHRPLVERALTAGFVLYCVGSTYLSLTGRGGKRESGRESGRRGRAKGESDPGLLDPVL